MYQPGQIDHYNRSRSPSRRKLMSKPFETIYMKKSLIALAAVASTGMASAQTSDGLQPKQLAGPIPVEVFGSIDLNVRRTAGSLTSSTAIASDGLDGSQIGVRGSKDFGNGLSGGYWLEAGYDSTTGAGQPTNTNNQSTGYTSGGLNFNRRATVSLVGGWGELRLGRDYSTTTYSLGGFDPFYAQGVGGNQMIYSIGGYPTSFRVSNAIEYMYNTHGWWGGKGFYGMVQHYIGGNARDSANPDDGTGDGIRLGFAQGPFDIAMAATSTRYFTGDFTQRVLAASWDLGAVTLKAQFSRDTLGAVDSRGYLIGAVAPVGGGMVRGDYSVYKTVGSDAGISKWALGYMYSLNQSTVLYATYAQLSNSGGYNAAFPGSSTEANGSSTGLELGFKLGF